MSRKLLFLDLTLVAVLIWAGFQFRSQWRSTTAREAATLHRNVRPVAPLKLTPLPAAPAVLASSYALIAQKMLFDRSRNPNVVVEVPPPPPPKPMPPLPLYHGIMNLGDGTVAIMSARANSPHEEVRPGGVIGDFKLVDVNSQEVALEWEGQVIRKKVDELLDHTVRAAPEPSGPEPVSLSAPAPQTPKGPGIDTGRGFKMCNLNDSTPPGAVVDGYQKTISSTPFGPVCRWDPVGR